MSLLSWKWPEELAPGTWALIAISYAATLAIALPMGFHGFGAISFKLLGCAALMLLFAGSAYIRRVPLFATIAAVFAWQIALVATMPLGNYTFAALNLPLNDTALQRIDHALGFDTIGATAWLGQFQLLSWGAAYVYHYVIVLMYVGFAVLVLSGDKARLRDTMTLTTVTLVITNVIAGLVPAIGPFALHGSVESFAGHLQGMLPTTYIPHVNGVRDGTLRFVGEGHRWDGLTTFPSYHTMFALCAGYALATTRYLAFPAALIAGAVVLATFPVGGHYAIDIAVGIAIFAAVTKAVHRINEVREPGASEALSGRRELPAAAAGPAH